MFIKYLKNLKQNIAFMLVVTLFSFAVAFFVTEYIHNNFFSYYEAKVESNEKLEDIYNLDYLTKLESDITNYNKTKDKDAKSIYYSTTTNYEEIYKNSKIEGSTILVRQKVFTTTQITSSGKISQGIEKFGKTMDTIFNNSIRENDNYKLDKDFKIVGYQNPYIISAITSSAVLFSFLILILILTLMDKIKVRENIYNNETIFKTPFHKKYFKSSVSHFYELKDLVMIALLFSMMLATKALRLPSGFGSLGINLAFIMFSVIAMLYGPAVGMLIGLLSDILGFYLFPSAYGFFIGYTLDAILSGLCYGICFYKTRMSFSKCFYARLFINLFVNVFCGSIWWSIINNFTFDAYINYMFILSLPKNLIYLLPQSIILFIILKPVSRIASHFSVMDSDVANNFTIF